MTGVLKKSQSGLHNKSSVWAGGLRISPTEAIVNIGYVIGYACGEAVTCVKIELSSTNVHAYPYKE